MAPPRTGLVKGLRIAGAKSLEQANRYLQEEFVAWWNQHLVVEPANAADAHRPLGVEHDLAASLSRVETRQVDNDYSVPLDGKRYGMVSEAMPAGLRGAVVRIERRLDGSLQLRFRERYWAMEECAPVWRPKPVQPASRKPRHARSRPPKEASCAALRTLLDKPGLPVWQAAQIDRTRTPDAFD